MRLIQIINEQRYSLISLSLLLYVMLNLFDGERGLISYYEKQKTLKNLMLEKQIIINKLDNIRNKNNLLTININLDYLEILYRNKFMLGKPNEKIFINE
jgi:cell division protein DivIC